MKPVCQRLSLILFLLFVTIPANGQDFNHKMHFPQLPDSSGWKVNATYPMGLADNWQCSESGMITEFDFWGGWQDGQVGTISSIMVAIFEVNLSSFPIWYDTYIPENYTEEFIYPDSSQHLGWYDPYTGSYIENDDNTIIHYTIRDVNGLFMQDYGQTYWFAVTVQAQDGTWGWITSNDHWNGGGYWSNGIPFSWHNLNDPVTPSEELDLSFVIATYDPMGACCLPDGSCDTYSMSHCQNLEGQFHGEGTICAGDINPPNGIDDICQPALEGACCYSGSSCSEGILYEDCNSADGQWFGVESQCGREPGHECENPENLNWNCSDRLPYGTSLGITEIEPDDECSSPNEVEINMAVCGEIDDPLDIDNYQLVIPADTCYHISIRVFANYTKYTYCVGMGLDPALEIYDSSCQSRVFYNQDNYGIFPEACGLDAQYEFTDAGNPHAPGSVLNLRISGEQLSIGPYLMVITSSRCIPGDETGVCCLGIGCEVLTEHECSNFGGTWAGANTLCQGDNDQDGIDDACESFVMGACCLPDGSCSTISVMDCQASGGIFMGVDSYCMGDGDQNGIDDACEQTLLRACCLPDGSCEVMTPQGCGSMGGDFYGTQETCSGDSNENGIDDLCEYIPGCQYVLGDANSNGAFNGIDVSYSVGYFKGGPPPPYICNCNGSDWFVAGDVNGNCAFNGIDVSYMVSYFKGGNAPIPCPDCPPGTLANSKAPVRILK